jgi:hypothetical protein
VSTRTIYTAKCYWPGVTASALHQAAAAAASPAASAAGYLGSLLFPDDELVLCLFEAPSRAAVMRTTERAGIPCERIMASRWLPASESREVIR